MEVPSEIMLRYLERRKQDLEDCRTSLEHKDFNNIEKVGHQLKGNGATFGHPELSQIGGNLELAAKSHDLEELQKIIETLSHWVDDLH